MLSHPIKLKEIAAEIADDLFRRIWAGELKKIGIDEIKEAVYAHKDVPKDTATRWNLVDLVLRKVVERVG